MKVEAESVRKALLSLSLILNLASSRNHWSNFNLIAVIQHFVFGDEIIALDDEMRFDDEIQFAQEFFSFLGTFDLDDPSWMAQLDLHGRIISFQASRGQGALYRDGLGVRGKG